MAGDPFDSRLSAVLALPWREAYPVGDGRLRVADLFCGAGGFTLGFAAAGWEPVWACDSSPRAVALYEAVAGDAGLDEHPVVTGDAREVTELPPHDVLCAGFPCQPFSKAGKGRAFDETSGRGLLVLEALRLAHVHRTPALLLENVRGLVSIDGGAVLRRILRALTRAGYACRWRVLDTSTHTSLPHSRARVFVAAFRDAAAAARFAWPEPLPAAERGALGDVLLPAGGLPRSLYHDVHGGTSIDRLVTEGIAGGAIFPGTGGMFRRNRGGRWMRKAGAVSYTLTHNMRLRAHVPWVWDARGPRRLHHREFMRLQGFDDRTPLPEGLSDTDVRGLMGNAVTVPLVERLARAMAAAMRGEGGPDSGDGAGEVVGSKRRRGRGPTESPAGTPDPKRPRTRSVARAEAGAGAFAVGGGAGGAPFSPH